MTEPVKYNRRKDDNRLDNLEKRVDTQDVLLTKIDKSQASTHKRLNELTDEVRISFEDIKDSQVESHKIIADKLEVTSKILAENLESTNRNLAEKLEKADRQRAEDLLKYQSLMIEKMTESSVTQLWLYRTVTGAWAAIIAVGGWVFILYEKIKVVKP